VIGAALSRRPGAAPPDVGGWDWHRGNQAFEDDHERELELRFRGYRGAPIPRPPGQ
jgi:hypothetical protein